jgi:hypothetical protein
MGWLLGGSEHTQLYTIALLTMLVFASYIILGIWGPDTPRTDTLVDTIGKAFTVFVGLFAGVRITSTRR